MKTKRTNFGGDTASSILLKLIFIFGMSLVASAVAAPGGLPFRVKSDGSVNLKDLMKMTRQPTARDRITDEKLAEIKSRHIVQYGKGFKPTPEPQMSPKGDLYRNSTILTDGKEHTLLPKYSLLNVPEEHRGKVVEQPVGDLVLWPKFLRTHSDWLRAREVSLEEAKGEREIDPGQLEMIKEDPKVVVSVMKRSPIGVLSEVSHKLAGETGKQADAPSIKQPE